MNFLLLYETLKKKSVLGVFHFEKQIFVFLEKDEEKPRAGDFPEDIFFFLRTDPFAFLKKFLPFFFFRNKKLFVLVQNNTKSLLLKKILRQVFRVKYEIKVIKKKICERSN